MTDLEKAARMVVGAWLDPHGMPELCKAMEALTAALEQPAQQESVAAQQEPVAWKHDCAALLTNDVELWIDRCPHCGKPRTTQQPAQQPLTDEQIAVIAAACGGLASDFVVSVVRAIEAAHGITGGEATLGEKK